MRKRAKEKRREEGGRLLHKHWKGTQGRKGQHTGWIEHQAEKGREKARQIQMISDLHHEAKCGRSVPGFLLAISNNIIGVKVGSEGVASITDKLHCLSNRISVELFLLVLITRFISYLPTLRHRMISRAHSTTQKKTKREITYRISFVFYFALSLSRASIFLHHDAVPKS